MSMYSPYANAPHLQSHPSHCAWTWPGIGDPNVIYRWDEMGRYRDVSYNTWAPLFVLTPRYNDYEYSSFRCLDLYAIVYGLEYFGKRDRGCEYQQFKDSGKRIRCKNCYQTFEKSDLFRHFPEILNMQVWDGPDF